MDLTEIVVGVITRAHGVRGEVVVSLRTDEPERRLATGQTLRTQASSRARGPAPAELTVLRTREHQGNWLVTFSELSDRTAAEAARGTRLVADVAADERPDDEDEYYDRQLVGLAVYVLRDDHGPSTGSGPSSAADGPSTGSGPSSAPAGPELVEGPETQPRQGSEPIGTVRSVLHLPAQDVLEIDTESGVRLIPFVSDLVPEVDLEAQRVTVADLAGLLADEPEAAEEAGQRE